MQHKSSLLSMILPLLRNEFLAMPRLDYIT